MNGLRTLLESARTEAQVNVLLANAMPESKLLCKKLFVREARQQLERVEKMLALPAIDAPGVLRIRKTERA